MQVRRDPELALDAAQRISARARRSTRPPAIVDDAPAAAAPRSRTAPRSSATAASQRGVAKVELVAQRLAVGEATGRRRSAMNGQPRVDYAFTLPANVPDGVIDIVVKAYDDIAHRRPRAPTITVTKGAPCTDRRRRAWPVRSATPAAAAGIRRPADARRRCTYHAVLHERACAPSTGDGRACTQQCIVERADELSGGLRLPRRRTQSGICWPTSDSAAAAAASAGDRARAVGSRSALAALVARLLMRRRRR